MAEGTAYSDVEKKKNGDVSWKASTRATPKAKAPILLKCMLEVKLLSDEVNSDDAEDRRIVMRIRCGASLSEFVKNCP